MADVVHDLPHLVVFQNALPRRHARRRDAVLDDPLQLPVFIILYIFRGEIGNWRGHLLREGHARILPIESMADLAMMLEMFAAFFYCVVRIGDGVLVVFAA